MRFEGIEIAVGHGDQRAEAFGAQRRNAVIVEAVGKGDFSLGKLLRFTVYGDGISALVDDEKRDLAVKMVGALVLLVEGEILRIGDIAAGFVESLLHGRNLLIVIFDNKSINIDETDGIFCCMLITEVKIRKHEVFASIFSAYSNIAPLCYYIIK